MPSTFTLTPSIYTISESVLSLSTPSELVTVHSRVIDPNPTRIFHLSWPSNATESDYNYIEAFFRQKRGTTNTFTWVTLNPVPPPIDAPTTGTASGSGPAGPRTIDVVCTWQTANGETTASSTTQQVVGDTDRLTVTAPDLFPTRYVTGYRVYAAVNPATPELQTTLTTPSEVYTEPGGGISTGTGSAPSSNTATENVTVHLLDQQLSASPAKPTVWSISLDFEEVPV